MNHLLKGNRFLSTTSDEMSDRYMKQTSVEVGTLEPRGPTVSIRARPSNVRLWHTRGYPFERPPSSPVFWNRFREGARRIKHQAPKTRSVLVSKEMLCLDIPDTSIE